MGIKDIKLGKRSRVLEERERLAAEAAERATEDIDFKPIQPPLPAPSPSAPSSLRGCGCARWHIPAGASSITVEEGGVEVEHRYSAPCRRVGGGPLPRRQTPAEVFANNLSLLDELYRMKERIEFLEAALRVAEGRVHTEGVDLDAAGFTPRDP